MRKFCIASIHRPPPMSRPGTYVDWGIFESHHKNMHTPKGKNNIIKWTCSSPRPIAIGFLRIMGILFYQLYILYRHLQLYVEWRIFCILSQKHSHSGSKTSRSLGHCRATTTFVCTLVFLLPWSTSVRKQGTFAFFSTPSREQSLSAQQHTSKVLDSTSFQSTAPSQ